MVSTTFWVIGFRWSISLLWHSQNVYKQCPIHDMRSNGSEGCVMSVTKFSGGWSLLLSSCALLKLGLSLSFLAKMTYVCIWFLYLTNFSICMYLAALLRSSSWLDVGFLHMLFTKAPSFIAIIMWCMATVGSKFQIFNEILLKHSMKVPNGSFVSSWMLTRAIDVKWWGRLVANYMPKQAAKV